MKRVIVWFRQDLRIHDNEALTDAIKAGNQIIPVYVFDERLFKATTRYGFPKTGIHRARFIIESVHDLRTNLINTNSELYIRTGKPEEIIFLLAQQFKTSWVFCNRERTEEEEKVQDSLEKNLWSIGQEVRFSRGKMLFYTADLPFPVTHTPNQYIQFKKEVDKIVPIRKPISTPSGIRTYYNSFLDPGRIPRLEDLGYGNSSAENELAFTGGESEGIERLNKYLKLIKENITKRHTEQSNDLSGFFTRLSPYLSQGCLSPKVIYYALKEIETLIVDEKTEVCEKIINRLMKRDFLRFIAKKFGNKIFMKEGVSGIENSKLSDDMDIFQIWAKGKTGIPIIDAHMHQLNQTGFISDKGRRLVASYLVNVMNINWQIGAEYFESILTDYDPCSNWGNWNIAGGVSIEHKESKPVNPIFLAKKFDAEGNFVKKWIPSLQKLPKQFVHQPYLMTEQQQSKYDFILGKDYPKAVFRDEVNHSPG